MLIGQLDQPQPHGGDVPVQVVQRGLQVGQPGRGQPFGLGLELVTGRGQPRRFGSQRGQVRGDDEIGSFQPRRQVGDADVGGTEPRPDSLRPFPGRRRFGVGGLLLLTRHALAGELTQLRMVK